MRLRVAAVSLVALAVLAAATACTVRGNFDNWIARQPVTVKYEPVPCDNPAFICGSVGAFDSSRNVIYLDPVVAARLQERQNQIDPSVSVMTQLYYHEWMHVADRETGFQMEGVGPLQFEHAAQCGMQLVTGRSYTFFDNPVIYWICPYADLERARWILTAYRVI